MRDESAPPSPAGESPTITLVKPAVREPAQVDAGTEEHPPAGVPSTAGRSAAPSAFDEARRRAERGVERRRPPVVAIVGVALALLAVGVGAALALSGSSSDDSGSTSSATTDESEVWSESSGTDTSTAATGDPDRAALVADLYALAERSAYGRRLTIAHQWEQAAANRRSIVRALDDLNASTEDLPGLRAAFRAAMIAAAKANEQSLRCGDDAAGPCSAPAHQRAHDLKTTFRHEFAPYVAEAGFDPIPEDEF